MEKTKDLRPPLGEGEEQILVKPEIIRGITEDSSDEASVCSSEMASYVSTDTDLGIALDKEEAALEIEDQLEIERKMGIVETDLSARRAQAEVAMKEKRCAQRRAKNKVIRKQIAMAKGLREKLEEEYDLLDQQHNAINTFIKEKKEALDMRVDANPSNPEES